MKEFIENLPLKIGDQAYGIRNYKGSPVVQCGIVNEIFFDNKMNLVFSVKHIGRGYYGVKIFKTYEEAAQAMGVERGIPTDYYTERFNKVV